MTPFQQHGAFSWCELMTSDPTAAQAFYGPLFGWTMQAGDIQDMPYTTISVAGAEKGGIAGLPPSSPNMPPAWGVYITVDDVDATAAQAQELGGQVLMPPMEIPTVGKFALLQDPQGATFCVITYAAQA
ncbi:VOC family protein [Leptolyngbya sp. PCC 6406]|uniref:VOC family protein n=1 Tax=Leptolyngbya sp. PCC 6406 TaxID=1173264 RepID=UPI0002AC7DE9|nr:VOC family protein [Leptolyngbya sp. PCC 6406]